MKAIKKVLVAYDGSEPSEKALNHTIEIAKKFHSQITLLTVVPTIMIPVFPEEGFSPLTAAKSFCGYQDGMKEVYEKALKEAEEKIIEKAPELKVETTLREGRPSKTIIEIAENEDFDLIVLGSRGIGGITGWILGSTSRRVVDSCTKPVLVVK